MKEIDDIYVRGVNGETGESAIRSTTKSNF